MNNKVIPLICFISLVLLAPFAVEAKSGCCSGHNGVNCGAGPQGNGHVICNDGSTTSSCLYSEMVMCGGSSSSGSNTTTTQKIDTAITPKIAPTRRPSPSKPSIFPTKKPTLILQPTATVTPSTETTVTITETLKAQENTKTTETIPTMMPIKSNLETNKSFFTRLLKLFFKL